MAGSPGPVDAVARASPELVVSWRSISLLIPSMRAGTTWVVFQTISARPSSRVRNSYSAAGGVPLASFASAARLALLRLLKLGVLASIDSSHGRLTTHTC